MTPKPAPAAPAPDPAQALAALPAPVLGKAVNLSGLKGTVTVQVPGSSEPVPVEEATRIPVAR